MPNHSTASFTSPRSDTHSASAPSGTSSCGIPGATFNAPNGVRRAASTAQDSGGEYASGSNTRPREVRRAGSVNTASKPFVSTSATSAQRTSTSSATPSAAAFARATSQVSSSRSTASTVIPARASAIASPPIPQHRSASRSTPSAANRPARHSATLRRVACSTPCWVKYIEAASAPNFASARCRSRACSNAARTSSAGNSRRSRVASASS